MVNDSNIFLNKDKANTHRDHDVGKNFKIKAIWPLMDSKDHLSQQEGITLPRVYYGNSVHVK